MTAGFEARGPTGLPRSLLLLVGTAAAVVAMVGIHEFADLIGPVFLALTLVIAVHPIRGWVAGRGLPGWVGTLAGALAVYGILLGLTLALILAVARFGTLVTQYQDEFNDLIDNFQTLLKNAGVSQTVSQQVLASLDLGKLVGVVGHLLGSLASLLGSLSFIVVLLFFMAIDAGGFTARLAQAPHERRGVVRAFTSFARGTRQYLVVSTVFGLVVAVLDVVALYILDVPDPWLWGLLAFITNYIPNVGFVIGLIPPAVLALLDNGFGRMLAVIAVCCVLNVIIQSVIQPKVVGDVVGLSGTLSFLSLIFWTTLLGPLGALLAIPLSLLVKALLVDVDDRTAWLGPLLSGKESAEPLGG